MRLGAMSGSSTLPLKSMTRITGHPVCVRQRMTGPAASMMAATRASVKRPAGKCRRVRLACVAASAAAQVGKLAAPRVGTRLGVER